LPPFRFVGTRWCSIIPDPGRTGSAQLNEDSTLSNIILARGEVYTQGWACNNEKVYVYNPGNSIEFPWGKWLKEVETGVKWLKEVGNRCKVASKKWKLV
jgi:hypothetical protein